MSQYKKYLFDEGPFKKPDIVAEDHLPVVDFPIDNWDNTKKQFDLNNIRDNDTFTNILFGVDGGEVVKNYLKFNVTCNVGTLPAKMWSRKGRDFNKIIEMFGKHKVYQVTGVWNEWPKNSGKMSIVVEEITPIQDVDLINLLPLITESRTDLRNELLFYLSTLSPEVKKLAHDILRDVWEDFIIRPAAMGHHHFQLGGLFQHTIEVMRIAYRLLEQEKSMQEETLEFIQKLTARALWVEKKKQRREGVDSFTAFYEKEDHLFKVMDTFLRYEESPVRDIVIFSILVHDIGKLLEYTHHGDNSEKYKLWFPGIEIPNVSKSFGVSMDEFGSKLGHITLGTMFLYRYWLSGEYQDIEHTFWFDVMGCILSHHGRLDWGSTKVPETVNELLVHFCDFIDSKYANEK